jgi:hypothetical protein
MPGQEIVAQTGNQPGLEKSVENSIAVVDDGIDDLLQLFLHDEGLG